MLSNLIAGAALMAQHVHFYAQSNPQHVGTTICRGIWAILRVGLASKLPPPHRYASTGRTDDHSSSHRTREMLQEDNFGARLPQGISRRPTSRASFTSFK